MANAARELSDRELFIAHIDEYLDDSIPANIKDRVTKFAETHKELPERYKQVRGRLQLALQSVYLNEDETLDLLHIIRSQEERLSQDEAGISQVARREFWSYLRRQLSFITMTAAVILIGYYVLSPKPRSEFDALQALAYEALSYEEDGRAELDFPTDSIEDVQAYFSQNPRFSVKPVAFSTVPGDWKLLGASVIDYDVAYIAVVRFHSDRYKEDLFHFSYEGNLADLLKSQEGDFAGFKYRTYASDKINLIAWQQKEGLIAFLVGHRSAEDLAKIAKTGLPR